MSDIVTFPASIALFGIGIIMLIFLILDRKKYRIVSITDDSEEHQKRFKQNFHFEIEKRYYFFFWTKLVVNRTAKQLSNMPHINGLNKYTQVPVFKDYKVASEYLAKKIDYDNTKALEKKKKGNSKKRVVSYA